MKTLTRKNWYLLAFLPMLFLSCGEDNSSNTRVKSMTQTYDYGGEGYSWSQDFFYDGSNRVVKLVDGDDETEYTIIQYNSQGKLAKVIEVDGAENDTSYYAWDGNVVTETYTNEDRKVVYTFNSNMELQKEEEFYMEGTAWVLDNYYTFIWQNGNLVEEKYYGNNYIVTAPQSLKKATYRHHANRQQEWRQKRLQNNIAKTANVVANTLWSKSVYTYDSKPNALADYLYASINGVYGSQNNLLTATHTDYDYNGVSTGDEVITYTNTYNSDGYPTMSVGVSDSEDYTETLEFVYESY